MQKTEFGMTGRIIFDNSGKRKDFYMEILELKQDGFKKIATMDPKHLSINYTRSQAEVEAEVSDSLKNRTMIIVAIISQPYLERR